MFRWGEAERSRKGKVDDDLRKILGENLYLIRFPLMGPQDFADVVRPTGILNSEECLMLYDFWNLSGGEK